MTQLKAQNHRRISDHFGNFDATLMEAMDAMYARVTTEFKLSTKTVLEGFSRGGLFALNWAARNPHNVACIYNDAPVCDFNSWPGGKG